MKPLKIISIVLAFAVITLIVVLISGQLAASAQASLGNSGVPVRCAPASTGQIILQDDYEFFNCSTFGGISFTAGQRVPTGYYLLVTDISATPDLSDSDYYRLTIYAAYGENSRAYSFNIMNASGGSHSEHFQVPYLILPEGYRIEGYAYISPGPNALRVQISGLLVTNLNYLPVVVK